MTDCSKPYSKGSYNISNDSEQHIRITEGCPNACPYCRESFENGKEDIYYEIPEIIRNKVIILDMNFTNKKRCLELIENLGQRRVKEKIIYYELQCGIDYRILNQEIASSLKRNHFINPRVAWDWGYAEINRIRKAINYLLWAGYKKDDIQCFILSDWKMSYDLCLKKLETLKYWNIQVSDCYYDNVIPPNYQCNYWNLEQCKSFRDKCRTHNQTLMFGGFDPEYLRKNKNHKLSEY